MLARLAPWSMILTLSSAFACGGVDVDTATSTATGTSGSTSEGTATSTVDPPPQHTWSVSADFGEDVGSIFSIWADGPGTIIAVGGQAMAGVAYEYKSGAWVAVEDLPDLVPRLNWIQGFGDVRVAVGYFGATIHREEGLWFARMSGTSAPLWGVWGATEDDLWAVGGGSSEGAVLLHFDGEAWGPVDISGITPPKSALYKIWGRAADDIYAVGSGGIILHYDGAQWSLEETPTGSTLIGIHGDDETVVVAGGRSSGVVLRRIDGAWRRLSFPEDEGFDGVMLDAEGYSTVVGRRGFIAHFAPGGESWVIEESGVDHELHSIIEVPGGPVFVVGGHFDSSPYTGVILERDPPP